MRAVGQAGVRAAAAWLGAVALGACGAAFDPDPAPGDYAGEMVGQVNGGAFRAQLSLTVDEDWGVAGAWKGTDVHSEWRGEVRGRAAPGALDCPGAGGAILCVSMSEPYVIATPAALFGQLGPGGGGGRFEFQAYAAEGGLLGEGTWRVE